MYSSGADFFIGMMLMKKITVIGGDKRLTAVKESLEGAGYTVDTLGLYPDDKGDFTTSKVIILPVPTTKDSVNVFTPQTNRIIPLKLIAENTTDQLILCCNYFFKNKKCVDYGSLDSYALLNAVPTAEGAIKLAIENTDFTLWKSKCLVIGYGRVGKVLANRLKALGCNVTITARKPADLSLAETLGFSYINTENLNNAPLSFDIIFNTVDVKVIDDEKLNDIKCELIIDLSTYGGLNLEKAEEKGIKTIKAAGLPAKVAPKTAAEILSKTVIHIINSYN